jgi:hypothetical protein
MLLLASRGDVTPRIHGFWEASGYMFLRSAPVCRAAKGGGRTERRLEDLMPATSVILGKSINIQSDAFRVVQSDLGYIEQAALHVKGIKLQHPVKVWRLQGWQVTL